MTPAGSPFSDAVGRAVPAGETVSADIGGHSPPYNLPQVRAWVAAWPTRPTSFFCVLVPRLCLGTHCLRGSASFALCGEALERTRGGAARTARAQAEPGYEGKWRRDRRHPITPNRGA